MSIENLQNAENILKRAKIIYKTEKDKDFSEATGIPQKTLSAWKARNKVQYDDLIRVLPQDVDLNYLFKGEPLKVIAPIAEIGNRDALSSAKNNLPEGVKLDDLTWLPYYEDATFEAGDGAEFDHPNPTNYLAFMADWVREVLREDHRNCCIVRVIGDSMLDYLADGDLVICRKMNCFDVDGVYAFYQNGRARVKRVQRRNRKIILKSDNNKYDPEELEKDDFVYVLGMVLSRVVRG